MQALLYVAAALTALWGIAHLCATRGVVRGFGELTADNRRIITMEWIVEGAALVSMGALVAAVTAVGPGSEAGLPPVATAAYGVAIATLVVLAVVSLFTGFRVKFLPFRLCPVIFTVSALGAWA
jgi:hypothetical protein